MTEQHPTDDAPRTRHYRGVEQEIYERWGHGEVQQYRWMSDAEKEMYFHDNVSPTEWLRAMSRARNAFFAEPIDESATALESFEDS